MSRALITVGQRLTYGVPKTIGPFMSDTQKVIAYLIRLFLPLDLIPKLLSLLPSFAARPVPRPNLLELSWILPSAPYLGNGVYGKRFLHQYAGTGMIDGRYAGGVRLSETGLHDTEQLMRLNGEDLFPHRKYYDPY